MKFPAFSSIDLKNSSSDFAILDIEVHLIVPDVNQPRKHFDQTALHELASSIKNHGVIQPIIVRSIKDSKHYHLIAGERRWRAAQLANLTHIPAIIREYNPQDRMAIALIENIQRENLNAIEEAQAIQMLLSECAMTHHQVAENIGKSRTTVSNLLRLLHLDEQVKMMIRNGLLEMGHARALLSLVPAQQIEIAHHIIAKSLSVREAERMVRQCHMPKDKSAHSDHTEFQHKALAWSERFAKHLASKVSVHSSQVDKGKIVIHFNSYDKAHQLMDYLNAFETEQ